MSCELLTLSGGESVLEIGCGWGAWPSGCIAVTVAKSPESRCRRGSSNSRAAGSLRNDWDGSADLRLQDYRDVQGPFDRIVSIEMLEAVGEALLADLFRQAARQPAPGGVRGIAGDHHRRGALRAIPARPDFIQQYIFPGGMLPTRQIIERETAAAGLKLMASEFFGRSYARTLAEWQHRFQIAWPAIAPLGFDARFKRIWEYYLAYCQAGFEAGMIDVGLYKLERPAGGG